MSFPKRQSLDSRKAEDIESLVFTLISTGEAQRKNPVEYIAELPISGNEINDFISVLEDGFVRYWDGTTRKLASDLISSIPTDPNNLGYFATQSDLTTAHPTASAGNYALVGATDSFWVWDDGTNSWIDSGTGSSPILTTRLNITGTIAPNTTLNCTSNGTNYTKRLSDPKLGATNTIFLDSGNIRIVVSGLECRKGIDVLRVSNTQLQFNLTLSNTDRVVIKS